MKASIIVCTYNRSWLLKCLLAALNHQSAPKETYEIIVIDDGSTDGTSAVCQNEANNRENFKFITLSGNSGLAVAGNRAIEESTGEYLLFTDDDCLPDFRWVENMCKVLTESPIVAGAMDSPRDNYFKLCHNIAQFYPFMPGRKSKMKAFIAGANMGMQRNVIDRIGFFNPNSLVPDMEFILRARQQGYYIGYAADAIVVHNPQRITLRSVLQYAAEHAVHTILLRLRYRKMLRTPFILLNPILLLLTAPLIAFKTILSIYLGNWHLLRYIHTAPLVFCIKLAWCWGAAKGLRIRRTRAGS